MLMPKVLPEKLRALHPLHRHGRRLRGAAAAIKNKLAGREFMHTGKMRYKVRTQDAGYDIFEILATIDQLCPAVRHPAVIEHPYTKEKVIYGNRGFTLGIADASLDESARLLKRDLRFRRDAPLRKEVQWSMGDVIIWDNRFLGHTSGRNEGLEEETMMYRITLQDGMPLCASQTVPGRLLPDRFSHMQNSFSSNPWGRPCVQLRKSMVQRRR